MNRSLPRVWTALCLAAALQIPPVLQAHDIETLSEAERRALWQEFRNYLMANPEVIIEAVNRLEEQEAAAEAEAREQAVAAHADQIFNDPDSWQGGNPNGDVTLVEFIDYRCGYCRRAHPEIEELLASDPGIRLIVKEFPILSQDSLDSAKLAVAALRAGGSDTYKAAHDFLIGYNGPINNQAIENVAALTGIDAVELEAETQSPEVENVIRANYELAEALSISGTPAFVVGSSVYPGYAPLDVMRGLIESERRRERD